MSQIFVTGIQKISKPIGWKREWIGLRIVNKDKRVIVFRRIKMIENKFAFLQLDCAFRVSSTSMQSVKRSSKIDSLSTLHIRLFSIIMFNMWCDGHPLAEFSYCLQMYKYNPADEA